MDSQKVLDTPLPDQWVPVQNDLVWLRTARKDGKVSTFRVRIMSVDLDATPEPMTLVEMFPEFELARPIEYPALLSNVFPLD